MVIIMARQGKRKDLQESAETGNDANKVLTIETIRVIFHEMFKQQEHVLIETVNSTSMLTNDGIYCQLI